MQMTLSSLSTLAQPAEKRLLQTNESECSESYCILQTFARFPRFCRYQTLTVSFSPEARCGSYALQARKVCCLPASNAGRTSLFTHCYRDPPLERSSAACRGTLIPRLYLCSSERRQRASRRGSTYSWSGALCWRATGGHHYSRRRNRIRKGSGWGKRALGFLSIPEGGAACENSRWRS